MKRIVFLSGLVLITTVLQAKYSITRFEPPCWWTGMKNPEVQIMVYGPAISDLRPVIDYPGVAIERMEEVPNPNYLFITLNLDKDAKPGKFVIRFLKDGKMKLSYPFSLLEREKGSADRQGFTNADVIYLITPDRFANGNPENDNVEGLMERADRSNPEGRHGGDIKGVADHLDYIAGMGYTALWLNPVQENDMPRTSYHGYAVTDFYKVDPRLGSNEEFRDLSKAAKTKGIKLIMDMIMNHCGSEHWWMKDLPSEDWINYGGKFVGTNHIHSTVEDPYASQADKKLFTDGWFVKQMPDLNQRNPLLAQYLIQNTIWWIEYADLGGIRMDTYPYPDKDFMTKWSCAIMDEYPGFSIVGEEGSLNPSIVAYWQRGNNNRDGYTSCLGSLMDFPMQDALVKGLNGSEKEWNHGLIKMYEMLANDFVYPDPFDLVIFPDNHDQDRFFTQVNEDFGLFKMGITYILTMRGIPQIFYGTEILMKNPNGKVDAVIRSDFPGGWKGDTVNVFTGKGLSKQQKEAKDYIHRLVNWRKNKTCIHTGKLIQFVPRDGIYVYFRYNDKEKVMVVLNKNAKNKQLDTQRFSEIIKSDMQGKDVISGQDYRLDDLNVPGRSSLILELH